MGKASKEELQYWHNQGQEDSARDVDAPWTGPWMGLFENEEEFQERQDAYDKGRENDINNRIDNACFLTTACVHWAGLTDDCAYLTVLREFRDNYVARQENGEDLINEYYSSAPLIVDAITYAPDKDIILQDVFETIAQSVKMIEEGRHPQALDLYSTMFRSLKLKFI